MKKTEENLVVCLKNILNNVEDPVYKKYKDETLTNKQFQSAKEEIFFSNKEKPKRDPKPTNHLLIPLPCDLKDQQQNQEKNLEQQNLISFFNDYIQNTNRIPMNEKTNVYFFVRDVFLECLGCLNNKEDGDFNKKMFFEKDEKILEYRKIYKILQEKINIIYNYQKGKKFKKKTLLKYGYITQTETDEEKDEIITKLKESIGFDNTIHKQNLSFRDFCRLNHYIVNTDDKSYIWGNKTMRIDERNISIGSKQYFETAGIKKPIIPKEKKEIKKKKRIV